MSNRKKIIIKQEEYIEGIKFKYLKNTGELHEKLKSFDKNYFIETGTFNGRTFFSFVNNSNFLKVKSIELVPELQERNRKKLKNNEKGELYTGRSDVVLPEILKEIEEPCVLFLDSHPSGVGTGGHHERFVENKMEYDGFNIVRSELNTILKHPVKNHVIIIDDVDINFVKNDLLNIFENYNMKDKYNFHLSNEGNIAGGRKDKILFCEPKEV